VAEASWATLADARTAEDTPEGAHRWVRRSCRRASDTRPTHACAATAAAVVEQQPRGRLHASCRQASAAAACPTPWDAKVANRDGRDSGWEIAHEAFRDARRFPSTR
jgi:hypothetical protein